MSIATLMAPPTPENLPSWQFDHAMAHREMTGGMSATIDLIGNIRLGALSHFSALPYFLDPQVNTGVWHLDHGQAHQDAVVTLPPFFGHHRTPETLTTIAPTQDFVDMDFDDQALLTWWTHANQQEHMAAQNVLTQLVYPFW